MSFSSQLDGVYRVTRQMKPRDAPGDISTRMSNTQCIRNFVLCLGCLLMFMDPVCVSARGLQNSQDNVLAMAAADDSPYGRKSHGQEDTEIVTQADIIAADLTSTTAKSIKHTARFKKPGELKEKFSSNYKHTIKELNGKNKESTCPILYSLASTYVDIDDIFQEESKTHKPTRFYPIKYRDEFHCLPCQCYFTHKPSVVASCNSSINEINAVLPKETQQLTISNSSMKVFQAKDFLRYHSLNNLLVSQNMVLRSIANNTCNTQMMTVTSLNLSSKIIAHIMDRSFIMFPNLTSLSLQRNRIVNITRSTFEGLIKLEFLNLVRNRLSIFKTGTFDPLKKLKVLDLSRNHYHVSFMPGVFSNLVNLRELFIHGDLWHAKSYPNEEIERLRNLTLLSIDGISEHVILGPQIKNLTKLVTLLVGFSITGECRLKNITESFLENVPYLQTVRFSKCKLTRVDPNVHRNVKDLRSLEFVSTYPYDIFKALDGLRELQNSSLKSVSFINLIKVGCPFICLYGNDSKYLKNIELEVIDLSYNRIGFMDEKFLNALPQTLCALVLRGNELIEPSLLTDKLFFLQLLQIIDLGDYTDPDASNELSQTQARGEVLQLQARNGFLKSEISSRSDRKQSVNWVAESDNKNQDRAAAHKTNELMKPSDSNEKLNNRLMYAKTFPECRQQYDTNNGKNNVSVTGVYDHQRKPYLPRRLSTTSLHRLLAPGFLEIDMVNLFKTIAHKYTNLTYIDFSYCALPSISMNSQVPASIQMAIFNGNYFRHLYQNAFNQNNSLTSLSLRNNLLGDIIASTNGQFFIHLINLVYLDISMNMIFKLPSNFLEGLNNLKYLIMADNKLNLLNVNFSTTPKLEYLDLRKNSISLISKSSRDELDIIGSKPNHSLYIELASNPLRCTCEGLEVLHWIWTSNIHFLSKDVLRCVRDDGTVEDMGNIDDRVRSLKRQCAGRALIIVLCVSSLVVICFLVVFGVMYRYRWQLRYIRNIALSRFIGYKPRDTACSEYRFDAFIVYSDMSRRFVFGDCLQELEVKRGHKLCVDDRDFMPGIYDVSAIVSAIQNSRKTVLILSPDFYDEPYSEYSVKMALMEEIYQKRSVLYLCVYRPLPGDEMSKSYDLLMIMNRNNYMEFPPETETSDAVRHNFWDQLSEKIGHSVTEEQVDFVE